VFLSTTDEISPMTDQSTSRITVTSLGGTVFDLEISKIQFIWQRAVDKNARLRFVTQIVCNQESVTPEPVVALRQFYNVFHTVPKWVVSTETQEWEVTNRYVVDTSMSVDAIVDLIRSVSPEESFVGGRQVFAGEDDRVLIRCRSEVAGALKQLLDITEGFDLDMGEEPGGGHLIRQRANKAVENEALLLIYLPTRENFKVYMSCILREVLAAFDESKTSSSDSSAAQQGKTGEQCEKCAELESRLARLERAVNLDYSKEAIVAEALADKFSEVLYAGLKEWLQWLVAYPGSMGKVGVDSMVIDRVEAKYPGMCVILSELRKQMLNSQYIAKVSFRRPRDFDLKQELLEISKIGKGSE